MIRGLLSSEAVSKEKSKVQCPKSNGRDLTLASDSRVSFDDRPNPNISLYREVSFPDFGRWTLDVGLWTLDFINRNKHPSKLVCGAARHSSNAAAARSPNLQHVSPQPVKRR